MARTSYEPWVSVQQAEPRSARWDLHATDVSLPTAYHPAALPLCTNNNHSTEYNVQYSSHYQLLTTQLLYHSVRTTTTVDCTVHSVAQ